MSSSPSSSSPPSYYSSPRLGSYAQPQQSHPSPPEAESQPTPSLPQFRQRKSATIISISPSSSISSLPSDDHNDESGTLPPTDDLAYASSSTKPSSISFPHMKREPLLPQTYAERCPTPPSPSTKPRARDALPRHVREISLDRRSSNDSSLAEEGEATETTQLLGGGEQPKWYQKPLTVAGIKLGLLFLIFTGVVVGTFWFGMPPFDLEDKKVIKIPRSFDDLVAINELFQKYKRQYPYRILACGLVSYLFVQTFSLPGSMYIAILFGAAYGIVAGLFLACFCESTGSLLCYTLSAILGPPLLTIPSYRARVEIWRIKLLGDPSKGKQISGTDLLAFLTVLRITPFPPHWITNFVAPHLGIGVPMFWTSCFVGIAPVSMLHATIGSSLDTMTSADDFHILSVKNVLGMVAVAVAILIPVALKRIFKKDLSDLEVAEEVIEDQAIDATHVDVPPVEGAPPKRYQAVDSGVILAGPSAGDPNLDTGIGQSSGRGKGKGRAVELFADIQEDDEEIGDATSPELHDPHSRPEIVTAHGRDEKRAQKFPFRGYGSIEDVPVRGYRDNLTMPFSR